MARFSTAGADRPATLPGALLASALAVALALFSLVGLSGCAQANGQSAQAAAASEGVVESPLPADSKTSQSAFKLGQGDVVEISVWGDQLLTRTVAVRPDGMVSFPLIGDVPAEGATVAELRQRIEARVKEFVPDAPVFVMLVKLQSPTIYVVGKVLKPGAFVMERETTVLQALALAGGLTPFAAENDIMVVRSEGGAQKSLPFRYGDVSSGRKLEQNVTLKPGDTVVVP